MDFIERSLSRQIAEQFQLLLCVLNKSIFKTTSVDIQKKSSIGRS